MYVYIYIHINKKYILTNIHTYILTYIGRAQGVLWAAEGHYRCLCDVLRPLLSSSIPHGEMYVCKYVCMYVHAYIHTYLHTCIHTFSREKRIWVRRCLSMFTKALPLEVAAQVIHTVHIYNHLQLLTSKHIVLRFLNTFTQTYIHTLIIT